MTGQSSVRTTGEGIPRETGAAPSEDSRRAPDVGSDEKQAAKHVEIAALRLLARREHSTEELRRKLLAKGHPEATIGAVIEKLGAKKQVSDDRFVSSFVQHHARRGQGPVRIRAELRQQGIPDSRIQQELASAEQDWNELAGQVRRRKFGASLPRGAAERAKQARFLQYRGFSTDQIRAALNFDPDAAPHENVDSSLDPEGNFDPDDQADS